MRPQSEHRFRISVPVRTIIVIVVILATIAVVASSFRLPISNKTYDVAKDSVESVKAFMKVYDVLMSPRCMNCHPSGDVPLQGDDSHAHTMTPIRGKDGKGVYAMKCSNCHQPENSAAPNGPPGNPNWHLPPANMKMVFQGRTPNQLAKQIMDPKQNGNKNKQQLIAHADDGLVLAGWNMGESRTQPPISHEEFKKAWITWINTGAYAPSAKTK